MTGELVQVNTSGGGMPKLPVLLGRVTLDGVEGDWQRNRKYHGGALKAICLFSEELYRWLGEQGISLSFGSVGENFTTRGIDLQKLSSGDRLRIGGECEIEITTVRVPCGNLKKWDVDLPELIVGRSGWYAKVVRPGVVKAGDAIEVVHARQS
jgi:MOSC domain-containing protein YiiM